MNKPRVKICCIKSIEEAKHAIAYGASALGLVGHMPSGPGVISDDLINHIARIVPPSVATFLLTSETRPEDIISHYRRVHTSAIQIVDEIEYSGYAVIRKEIPHVKLVQVIHVVNENSVQEAIEVSGFVDAILLDSGDPTSEVKVLGGTGSTHDWELSRKIRERINIPLYLAGGINKDNVKQAIEAVQPFGIDLCSSVRTEDRLDTHKLEEFFNIIEHS